VGVSANQTLLAKFKQQRGLMKSPSHLAPDTEQAFGKWPMEVWVLSLTATMAPLCNTHSQSSAPNPEPSENHSILWNQLSQVSPVTSFLPMPVFWGMGQFKSPLLRRILLREGDTPPVSPCPEGGDETDGEALGRHRLAFSVAPTSPTAWPHEDKPPPVLSSRWWPTSAG
jgi:hypothetical protein